METLRVNEIFHSIQGESSWAGQRCVFVRLTGCPLRCSYCDTEYAFREGKSRPLGEVIREVQSFDCPLVELTGGEPLAQAATAPLARRLYEAGHTVLIETSGAVDISPTDHCALRILDIKTPSSGEAHRMLWSNIEHLHLRDEVKFVIGDRNDYEFARETVGSHALLRRCRSVLFSPVFAQQAGREIAGHAGLSAQSMAEWILADRLNVRLQLQLHKFIWEPLTRGV